jgi:hypothetical protein
MSLQPSFLVSTYAGKVSRKKSLSNEKLKRSEESSTKRDQKSSKIPMGCVTIGSPSQSDVTCRKVDPCLFIQERGLQYTPFYCVQQTYLAGSHQSHPLGSGHESGTKHHDRRLPTPPIGAVLGEKRPWIRRRPCKAVYRLEPKIVLR